jgi:hypothetical protein
MTGIAEELDALALSTRPVAPVSTDIEPEAQPR